MKYVFQMKVGTRVTVEGLLCISEETATYFVEDAHGDTVFMSSISNVEYVLAVTEEEE